VKNLSVILELISVIIIHEYLLFDNFSFLCQSVQVVIVGEFRHFGVIIFETVGDVDLHS
jgi:hypothetical protein